jgi:Skp family chaperone for outer membrane proteins
MDVQLIRSTKGQTGMRVFAVAVALSVTLAAAPSYAQAPAAPAPQPTPPPAAAVAPAPAQSRFQDGLKYGLVNLQQAFAQSSEGQRVQDLYKTRQGDIAQRQKQLQEKQQKAQTQASVLSEDARAKLQTELDRDQRDFERFVSDAEEEVQRLSQQAEADFNRRFGPVLEKLAQEKELHFVLRETGLVWAAPAVDLTPEVVKQLAATPAPPPAATQKPAAPAAGTQKPATQKP